MASENKMGVLGGSSPNANPSSNRSSDSSSGSEMEFGSRRLGEMELDAARALADMAKVEREDGEGERRSTKRVKHAARACGKRLKDLEISRTEPTYFVDEDPQNSKASDAEVDERLKVEQNSELSISNISCAGSHVSCFGRRMKQNMTEAEKEARRIRRVLANRESARQTIRRRQALREELIKRVADLSLENENMKVEKELVMKEYLSLKDRNKALKKQMAKAIKFEVELRAKNTSRDVETSTSPSTELSLVAPIRSSGVALAHWPTISSDAASCNGGGSSRAGASRTLFYVPPYAWFYPSLHQTSESYPPCCQASDNKGVDFVGHHHGFSHCPQDGGNLKKASLLTGSRPDGSSAETGVVEEEKVSGINLEEMPKEFDEHDDVGPTRSCGVTSDPCPDVKGEQETGTEGDRMTDQLGTKSQVSPLPPLKKLVDPSAAAAARKRRKELTKFKYLHARQIRLHG